MIASSLLTEQKLEHLKKYLLRKDLQEISVNQPGELFLNYGSHKERVGDKKLTAAWIRNFINQMASINNQTIDPILNPILSAKIPYKERTYRLQAVMGSCVIDSGMQFTIRIPSKDIYPLSSYIKNDSDQQLLIDAVRGYSKQGGFVYRKNILIGAGVGVGKTSFLNSLIHYCDDSDRVISLEDVPELNLDRFSDKVRYLIPRNENSNGLGYAQFIDNAVRQAFQRIFIGEISIKNTESFMRMLNSGHGGCISTIHADNVDKIIDALVLNLRFTGFKGSDEDIKNYCKSHLHFVIHLIRDENFNYQCTIKKL